MATLTTDDMRRLSPIQREETSSEQADSVFPVSDARLAEVVGRHLDFDPVAHVDANPVLAHFAGDGARTSCPFDSATLNIVPGKTRVTAPVNSIGSSLATKESNELRVNLQTPPEKSNSFRPRAFAILRPLMANVLDKFFPAPLRTPVLQRARIFAVLAILLAVIVRARTADMPLERDEGEYAYAGQLILQGVPPYHDAFNMKLPAPTGLRSQHGGVRPDTDRHPSSAGTRERRHDLVDVLAGEKLLIRQPARWPR